LREQVGKAHEQLVAALQAIQAKDAARADAALTECRKAIAPVREAAKKPAR
jgi:cellobiose-specific phosphotransferase system component IIA